DRRTARRRRGVVDRARFCAGSSDLPGLDQGEVVERSPAWPVSGPPAPLRSQASTRGRRFGSRPHGDRGQRYQDGLDIAAGLEAEHRAAVVEEVERDVAAAADELMAALLLAPGAVLTRGHDRRVSGEEGAADIPGEGEIALPVAGIQIVVKDAADAARLA